MKGVVTNRQIFFLILFSMTQLSLVSIPRDAMKASGTGSWFTMLILIVIFGICIYFMASLNKKFEGKTLYEYSCILVGKTVAKILTFLYFCYFLLVLILIFKGTVDFIKMSTLYKTPVLVILFLFLISVTLIAYRGITNIGRICELYGAIFIIVSLGAHTAELFLGDINYIKPFFEIDQTKQYIVGVKDLIVPFLGFEFLLVVPFNKVNRKKGILFSILGVVYVGLFYIYATETSVMILGSNDVFNYDASLVEALHETRLPSAILLERVDLLFLTVGTFGILMGLCITFCISIEFFSKVLPRAKRAWCFVLQAVVVYIISGFVIDSKMAKQGLNTIVPIAGLFVVLIIPFTLFIISKVKKYAV